jgi:signal transduction histidine kinase/CheY-like chemotaxis protein/HPt (histidine-containing phosphotransfer) domain-containing protein
MSGTGSFTTETLFGILDNFDEFVYVTDPADDKILFVNEPLKKHFNMQGDVVGQRCYQLFQESGQNKRCDFCACHQLEKDPSKKIVWIEHNTLMKRSYRNTDIFMTLADGKVIHVGYSQDITGRLKRDQMMQAVNRAAALLLAPSNKNGIETPLVMGMELIGCSINADRVHIWRNEAVNGKMHYVHTFGWYKETNEPAVKLYTDSKFNMLDFPEWNERFLRGEHVGGIVSTLSDKEKNLFNLFGIKSIIILPLILDDNFWGLFSVDDCTRERGFEDEEIDVLRSVSLMMANAINQNEMIKKMNEAHERSMIMLDTSPICAQIWTRDLSTIDCNEAGVRLYGFKNKQEYTERFLTNCSPEYQPCGRRSDDMAVALVNEAFEKGKVRFDWMHKMPDSDELIPADVTLVRSMYKEQEIVIGYTTDMREQMKNIENIKNLTKERTEAEIASQTKSSFLASMSHEIRTPMNAILGVTDILMENRTINEDVKEGLNKIYNSGNLLLGIINDILDFSKIEAGKMDILPAPYSMAELIGDSAHLNAMRIEGKPIVFKVIPDENIPAKLIGDELRIKQILNNILSNALKYTDKGTVTFTIYAEPTEDGVNLVLSVRDTGIGMTENQLDKLFEEYSRFEEGTNRGVEGTGLGLAITNHLVHLMNGSIHVESTYGEGSLFTVKLPQKTVDKTVLGAEMAENIRHFRMVQMGRKEKGQIIREPMPYGRVLVVDDVEPNLYVAEGLMKPYGLTIETVTSGYDAIDKIKNGNVYDIIFMDHMMPNMDGIETTLKLRGAGYTEPIVALTANALAGQADLFFQNGFNEFISKPIDIRQLNQVLNKLVRDKQPPEIIEAARLSAETHSTIPQEASRLTEGLRTIDGLNVTAAVTSLGGMYEVYENTVRLAARLMPESIKKMDEYLTAGNLKSFAIEVHGVKGVTRSIGADKIADIASRLEISALNNGKVFCEETYPDFKSSVLLFINQLNTFITEEPATTKKSIETTLFVEKIKEAKNAADGYDTMAALDIVKPLTGFLIDEKGELLLKKVLYDLEIFDCIGASQGLAAILELFTANVG